MRYLSPRAYEFIRSVFNDNLPHHSTIKSWYRNSNLDSGVGIGENALKILQEKAIEMKSKNQQLICSLSFDEMRIRQLVQWCNKTNKFIGYATYGDTTAIATNMILFLVNGVNTDVQIPVAYHFITNINSDQRKELLLEILGELWKHQIYVSNITFDGLSSNALMCTQLGSHLAGENIQSYFINPHNNEKVYIIFDPCHAIKLVRNNLSNHIIFDADNNEIKFDYFVKLVEFGKNNNFKLTHKLSQRHIDFEKRMMHVRTAVETLSNSVADSLEFLMNQGIHDFHNAAPTINFIRIFDSLFDVFNTQRIEHRYSNQLKSAMNFFNQAEVFEFLEKAKKYILGLKVIEKRNGEIVPIVASTIKTGFRGFVLDIESIQAMYCEYVEERQFMHMIPTYRLNQDHLEMTFGKFRSMHGCNDNPSVQQSMSSYTKIQLIKDFLISRDSNVENLCTSNILSISSRSKSKQQNHIDNDSIDHSDNEENIEINDDIIVSSEVSVLQELETIEGSDYLVKRCSNSAISFVSFKIEKRLLNSDQIYCKMCEQALIMNEKLEQQDCVGNSIPCKSTFEVCKATDEIMKQFIDNNNHTTQNVKLKIITSVLQDIQLDTLYPKHFESDSGHDINHKQFLVRFIIGEYVGVKFTFQSKEKTLSLHKNYIRHKARKDIHLAGQ